MPEHLFPGVYVEETSFRSHPIDGVPTSNVEPIFADIQVELKTQTDKLQQTLTTDLPTFNRLAERKGLEPVKEK